MSRIDASAATAAGATPGCAIPGPTARLGFVGNAYGHEDRSKGAETKEHRGYCHKERLLCVDPPHREVEGPPWLAASAFGVGIPLLLASCFLSIAVLQTAQTPRRRHLATLAYLLSLLAACLAIYAAVG